MRFPLIIIALVLAACTPASRVVPFPTPAPSSTSTITALAPTPSPTAILAPLVFDGVSAFEFLQDQMAMGPRWPGSDGHAAVRLYIANELSSAGWEVEIQNFDYQGFEAQNIIGRANLGAGDVIVIGAHYDTRRIADETPGAAEAGLPVPGAVDGGSGVAVLLELARSLDLDQLEGEVRLVFFDVEDNGRGGIEGWDYAAGSQPFVDSFEHAPAAAVVVDMVGDADQQLFYEGNSDAALRETLWGIAADLGYSDAFIPSHRYTMLDDHLAFVRAGVPVVLIIDFDYPYWHTVEDTVDKASPASLERVGRTLEVWLEQHVGH